MTNKEYDIICNDSDYYVLTWDGGKIYTKRSLLELRCKKIAKLFKDVEYHARPCSYNDYFMSMVYVIYKRLKQRDNWYKSRGYRKIYYKDSIGYEFVHPRDLEDY